MKNIYRAWAIFHVTAITLTSLYAILSLITQGLTLLPQQAIDIAKKIRGINSFKWISDT